MKAKIWKVLKWTGITLVATDITKAVQEYTGAEFNCVTDHEAPKRYPEHTF
ncbi:MAG: hypothetical protein KDD19_01190 [Phaeodactylibacter sp.]|nr:hypothetical protein [Phaeodactylibacter sp.]MCB9050811.1 hypothetical protein [Lewinellaceae bacterium]